MDTALRDGINWVGYVDWTVRDFHGYRTERGSSYNAYLVQDEKTALIDTVKAPYADVLLAHIDEQIDPASVDYVVCNHAEPDHAGSLTRVLHVCRNAELICDEKCLAALQTYHDSREWKVRTISDGDELSLGDRTLRFVTTPMVHWPESMATYVAEDKVLFSMDAFGQHIATSRRFDDQESIEEILAEAKTYYANILMLYGRPISRTMNRLGPLEMEMLAPSHGVIWRSHVDKILSLYNRWMHCKPVAKVLIVYDTMWNSTEMMAHAILEGAMRHDVEAKLIDVRQTHITTLATEMLDAAGAAFGSATLNTTLMPTMAAALTYINGLKPSGKVGFAFGSYGWGRGGALDVEEYLKSMRMRILRKPLRSQFRPDDAILEECREAGEMLATEALEIVAGATTSEGES